MSMMLMAQAFQLNVGHAGKKLVLLKLADNASDKGECWPSYQHVADQCEISRRSAMRYIEQLIDDGWIEKSSRKGPKGNSTNMYMVTLRGVCSAPQDGDSESLGGDSLLLGGSDTQTPDGDTQSLGSDTQSPGGGDTQSPGISHSFESVSEPVSEPLGSASDDDSPSGVVAHAADLDFPTKCGKGYRPSQSLVDEIYSAYPELNVLRELQRARLWLIANPSKRKTVRGMPKFLTSWMGRQQPNTASQLPRPRHSGFSDIDYSKGLKQGVPDGVANF